MYIQGDVVLTKIDKLPENLKQQKSGLLKFGSATGHSHALDKGKVYLDEKDNMFIDAKDSTVIHNEHKPIKIEDGCYAVTTVIEYDHFEEEARKVVD